MAPEGGHLYIFTLAGNNPVPGSPFAFPTGTDTGNISGVVYDPYRNQAVISVCDSAICDGFANPHTGWTFFNLTSAQFFPGQAVFGPVLAAAEPDSLSLNPLTQLVIAPADAIDPPSPENAIDAGDTTHSCTLSDKNLAEDQGDPDGSTADPTTNLFAVGDFFQPIVTVLNLNGAHFSGNKAPCSLIEAGTNPNSVDVRVFAATGDPADVVALNQEFHQVLVASDLGPDVGLISLPTSPVFQLTGPLKFQASKLPDEPDGGSFAAFVLPFTATVEDCNKNQGLIVDDANRFLARVDLGILQNSPAKISTPLPAGKCTGGFNVSCSNGNGVRFFPLLAGGTDPVHKRRRRR